MNRIYILGTSGAGKSTLANALSASRAMTHLELDSIYHQPNWTPLPTEEFRAKVQSYCERETWVIDGNYSVVRDVILARADAIILLDYSRFTIMVRVIRRTLRRMLTRQELWNGNREEWKYLFTPNREKNIVLWAWSTFAERRASFEQLVATASVPVLRFTKPSQTNTWLRKNLSRS